MQTARQKNCSWCRLIRFMVYKLSTPTWKSVELLLDKEPVSWEGRRRKEGGEGKENVDLPAIQGGMNCIDLTLSQIQ